MLNIMPDMLLHSVLDKLQEQAGEVESFRSRLNRQANKFPKTSWIRHYNLNGGML